LCLFVIGRVFFRRFGLLLECFGRNLALPKSPSFLIAKEALRGHSLRRFERFGLDRPESAARNFKENPAEFDQLPDEVDDEGATEILTIRQNLDGFCAAAPAWF
jgi:hypothetical protein